MTNTYLTDSDVEVIIDSVKDHEELYDRTNGPQQPAATPREYILTIPETQMIQASQTSQLLQPVQA